MEILFPQKIARITYLARSIVLTIAVALVIDELESGSRSRTDILGVMVIIALVAYWTAFVVAPRCRDLAMSAWFALLVFVPGVDLFFCGYLAWGATKVRSEIAGVATADASRDGGANSESLRRLEALRYEGVITEQDFLRRKARLRYEQKG